MLVAIGDAGVAAAAAAAPGGDAEFFGPLVVLVICRSGKKVLKLFSNIFEVNEYSLGLNSIVNT